ncbi:hypothetical protein BDF19DRAFT_498128 [Syncephalis fuscata]|nr:hypothetical protein BDF19DRAFT_498128 [Syncephalis fuscata]
MSDDSSSNSVDNVAPTQPFVPGTKPLRDITFALFFLGFGCLHFWRYIQTRTKYHGMMIGAILIGAAAFGMHINGLYKFNDTFLNYSKVVLLFAGWIIKIIVAKLMLAWSQSMRKVIVQRAQLVYRFGINGMVFYSIGCALVLGGWILLIRSNTFLSEKKADNIIRAGYSITSGFSFLSAILFLWQYAEIKRNNISELDFKCRQLLVLAAHCILISVSDMGYLLYHFLAGHTSNVLVLFVGVYTRKALTGFDKEPTLTSRTLIAMSATAYNQRARDVVNDINAAFTQSEHSEQHDDCQRRNRTEETITTTYFNVQPADLPEFNALPSNNNYASVIENLAANLNLYTESYSQE